MIAAEHWLSKRPRETLEPTELHVMFLQASRKGEQTRIDQEKTRLIEVANAQARTRRAQRRTFGVLTLMLIGVVIGLWSVYTFWQSVMLNRAQFIATQADDQTQRVGDPVTAMLLALEALPNTKAASLSRRMMTCSGHRIGCCIANGTA
jgi:hypothetical protein